MYLTINTIFCYHFFCLTNFKEKKTKMRVTVKMMKIGGSEDVTEATTVWDFDSLADFFELIASYEKKYPNMKLLLGGKKITANILNSRDEAEKLYHSFTISTCFHMVIN